MQCISSLGPPSIHPAAEEWNSWIVVTLMETIQGASMTYKCLGSDETHKF